MTKMFLTAALAAVLLAPVAATTHAASIAGPNVYAAGERGQSKCESITDPVKKQECLKQESMRDGQGGGQQ